MILIAVTHTLMSNDISGITEPCRVNTTFNNVMTIFIIINTNVLSSII